MTVKPTKLTGVTLAAAAAGLFATLTVGNAVAADQASADKASVKCEHSTSCKGHGECSSASNACKGMNSCKGKGWTTQKSEADCKAAQAAVKA